MGFVPNVSNFLYGFSYECLERIFLWLFVLKGETSEKRENRILIPGHFLFDFNDSNNPNLVFKVYMFSSVTKQ